MPLTNSPSLGGSFLDMTTQFADETLETFGARPQDMISDMRSLTVDLFKTGR